MAQREHLPGHAGHHQAERSRDHGRGQPHDHTRGNRTAGGIPARTQVLSILLVDLASIAAETGVEIRRFAPEPFERLTTVEGEPALPPEFSDLGKQRISLDVRGRFPNIVQLFDRLATYEGVLQVAPPTISGGSGKGAGNAGAGQAGADSEGSGPEEAQDQRLDVGFSVTTYALDH